MLFHLKSLLNMSSSHLIPKGFFKIVKIAYFLGTNGQNLYLKSLTILYYYISGAGCSKLTTSLVNISLNFKT